MLVGTKHFINHMLHVAFYTSIQVDGLTYSYDYAYVLHICSAGLPYSLWLRRVSLCTATGCVLSQAAGYDKETAGNVHG